MLYQQANKERDRSIEVKDIFYSVEVIREYRKQNGDYPRGCQYETSPRGVYMRYVLLQLNSALIVIYYY